ncbi:MAG: hypothetical protein DWH82_03790 [Planctomycetota bacterium]|nr:MAG: hypothetical protein DWH82_03790 [Planctomycetota bacterium]
MHVIVAVFPRPGEKEARCKEGKYRHLLVARRVHGEPEDGPVFKSNAQRKSAGHCVISRW